MPYTVTPTALAGVLILEPKVHGDARGWFYESFNSREFHRATGLERQFVQDNQSYSTKGVLRGLHYQIRHAQGKLVRVLRGEIYDVAVDIRRSSPTVGKWVAVRLDSDAKRQLWVPEGFAHGFLVTSETAEVLYKTTDFYSPEEERTLLWNDASLGITWPLDREPVLAAKDLRGVPFAAAELFD